MTLYAVTAGPGYKGPAEFKLGLPKGRRVPFSTLREGGAYAEFEGSEEDAARLAEATGLTIAPIERSTLAAHALANPESAAASAKATKTERKRAKKENE